MSAESTEILSKPVIIPRAGEVWGEPDKPLTWRLIYWERRLFDGETHLMLSRFFPWVEHELYHDRDSRCVMTVSEFLHGHPLHRRLTVVADPTPSSSNPKSEI